MVLLPSEKPLCLAVPNPNETVGPIYLWVNLRTHGYTQRGRWICLREEHRHKKYIITSFRTLYNSHARVCECFVRCKFDTLVYCIVDVKKCKMFLDVSDLKKQRLVRIMKLWRSMRQPDGGGGTVRDDWGLHSVTCVWRDKCMTTGNAGNGELSNRSIP